MVNKEICQNKTDEELVSFILKDQDYFSCLIDRYENKLLNYIMRISGFSREEAEDVLQEVFIKVYRNLNEFDRSLKFSSWIYRITRNETISQYRKDKIRPQKMEWDINDEILNNIVSDLDLREEIDLKYLSENIKKVLENMDDKYSEVLALRFLEEKDYREISDILKKPMGTIATLINRAKKKFIEEIKRQNIKL